MGKLTVLEGYILFYQIALILIIVPIIIWRFIKLSKLKKWNFRPLNMTSFIATYVVLFGFLAYTFYYLPEVRALPYLEREFIPGKGFDLILTTLKKPSVYAEFATFATLGGLYHLLSENRLKHKKEKAREDSRSLKVKLKEKDAEIARLQRLMLIHWIPRQVATKIKKGSYSLKK